MEYKDQDGFSKLNKTDHFELGKAWHQKHGSMKGFKEKYGIFVDPKKGPMMFRAFTNKKGQHYTYN